MQPNIERSSHVLLSTVYRQCARRGCGSGAMCEPQMHSPSGGSHIAPQPKGAVAVCGSQKDTVHQRLCTLNLVCSSAVRCDDTPGGNGSIRIIRSPWCPVNPCSRPASSCSFEQQNTSSSHRLTMDQQQCVAVWKSQTQTRTWRD